MADKNNNNNNEMCISENGGKSTDSNLPVLFADGYPTSLEKMSVNQLELFIPFLLRCSSVGKCVDPRIKPEWWPRMIPFKTPIEKPNELKMDWLEILRNTVRDFYDYHKEPYLLVYSETLAEIDKANLRYVTDSDSATRLYSRKPEKLLLICRNENMLYDKKKRMTLWKKHEETPEETDGNEESFVSMLCYYCDAVFYSDEAYTKHERECADKDDGSRAVITENIVISDDDDEDANDEANVMGGQSDFMAYFFLKSTLSDEIPRRNNSMIERSLSPKKKKKQSQRTRPVSIKKEKDLERFIPFSSPAGIVLTKKNIVGDQYIKETQEFIDEFIAANGSTKISSRGKLRYQVSADNAVFKEMRKPRHFHWPKRTLRSQTREANFNFLNQPLIKRLKPCSIVARKLTNEDVQSYLDRLKDRREKKQLELKAKEAAECVDLCSDSEEEELEYESEVKNNIAYTGDFYQMHQGVQQNSQFSIQIPLVSNRTFREFDEEASTSKLSMDISTSPSHMQLFQQPEVASLVTRQIFQQVNRSSNIIISKKRPRESDDSNMVHNEKRSTSIQSWIQTVNSVNVENINQIKNVTN